MNSHRLKIIAFTVSILLMLSSLAIPGKGFAAAAVQGEGGAAGEVPTQLPKTNGEYTVFLEDGNTWTEAGSVSCDEYFRDYKVDLSASLSSVESLKVRIKKANGGAAHLDSVLLGGKAPVSVNGEAGLEQKKLSLKDMDVINVPDSGVELVFPAGIADGVLDFTGRIEGERINEKPFLFPPANHDDKIGGDSVFYKYTLGSKSGSLAIDGQPDEVSVLEPFFKEYTVPGTGHPSGFTYGWVMNDENSLYFTMDFTPDNTMDGDKDYAKVYVDTGSGIKEFKVSVPETAWGRAGFNYTDKVGYQHKIYEFGIPLNEIGITAAAEEKEISLAFAAYGTAAPAGQYSPGMAYDAGTGRVLTVYEDSAGTTYKKVFGRIYNSDGSIYKSDFLIADSGSYEAQPSVVSGDGRFLVAWKAGMGITCIKGAFIGSDGNILTADPLLLSDSIYSTVQQPAAAYDDKTGNFLLVWVAGSHSDRLLGRIVTAEPSLKPVFTISDISGTVSAPSLATDNNGAFLAVWQRYNQDSASTDIYSSRIEDAIAGASAGQVVPVSQDAQNQQKPAVAFNSGRYFVSYENLNESVISNVYGNYISSSGIPEAGGGFYISEGPVNMLNPGVCSDSDGDFLVVWQNSFEGNIDIYSARIDPDGDFSRAVYSKNIIAETADQAEMYPKIMKIPGAEKFALVYQSMPSSPVSYPVVAFNIIDDPDIAAVNNARDNLGLGLDGDCAYVSFELPAGYTYNVDEISWSTGNPDIIALDGIAYVNTSRINDALVKLTAQIVKGKAKAEKVISVRVKGKITAADGSVLIGHHLFDEVTSGTQDNYTYGNVRKALQSGKGVYITYGGLWYDLLKADGPGYFIPSNAEIGLDTGENADIITGNTVFIRYRNDLLKTIQTENIYMPPAR